jgi:hypothetical protein
MSSDPMQSTYDPRYEGIYQRGGATESVSRMASPAPLAPALPDEPAPAVETSAIREVAAPAQQVEAPPRNPYDRWAWITAGLLAALGVFLLAAPSIYAQQSMEALTMGQPYVSPWYDRTIFAAPVLLLLGITTAVAQLFVLSIRHTLTTRTTR